MEGSLMKKKVLALLLVVSMVVALAACQAAKTYSTVEITSKDGAGNKTIVVSIPKNDGDGNPDAEQELFFPSGFDAVTDFLNEELGDDFTVTFEEKDESWDYTLKFSFSDIDDYNTKMKEIAGDSWVEAEEYGDAKIEVEEADGGYNVTFTENLLANRAVTIGILTKLYEDEDLFDPARGGDKAPCDIYGHESLTGYTIIVGDAKEEKVAALTDDDPAFSDTEKRAAEDFTVTVTGFVSADGAADKTPAPTGGDDKSPKTGDYGVAFAMAMLLASGVVLTSRKMAKSK